MIQTFTSTPTAPFVNRLTNQLYFPVKRWLLLNFYLDNSFFREQPDRVWLEQELRPRLQKLPESKVLFVGCAPYTWEYLHAFPPETDLITLDIDPRNAIWGAAQHLTADIMEADKLIQKHSVNLILLNGIFGHGVDTPEAQEKTYRALHRILKPGGVLLVGWNHDLSQDPLELPACHELYFKSDFEGLPIRTCFTNCTHVFDFLKARPELN